MRHITQVTIEHSVVTSERSYAQVTETIEAQLGKMIDLDALQSQIRRANASWAQAVQLVEQQLGASGFTLFAKFNPGDLLTFSGKPTHATQYIVGNPLLAIQMIEHNPEAALYAPLRLVVYENQAGNAVVAYERFTTQLAQYSHPKIAAVARQVESKLEKLIAEVTGDGQEMPTSSVPPHASSLPEAGA